MTKVRSPPFLHVEHLGDEDAGIAGDQPPGLEEHAAADLVHVLPDDVGIGGRERRRRLVVAIGDAEPAAEIDVLDCVAVGAKLDHELGDQAEGVVEGLKIGDLAADMRVDADDAECPAGAAAGA